MSAGSTFTNSLPFGQQYEGVMGELIKDRHSILKYGPTGQVHKEWDIMGIDINDAEYNEHGILTPITTITTYESKADTKTKDTGNIAIEFRCSGKDSGITTSTATYWFYFVHNPDAESIYYYEIPTDEIREAIAADKYRGPVRGGDNNNAEMYLFSQQLFMEYRKVLNKKSITEANRPILYKIYEPNAPHIFFSVPIAQKDVFKAYRLYRWNPLEKAWSVPESHPQIAEIIGKFKLYKCTVWYKDDDDLERLEAKFCKKFHKLNMDYKCIAYNTKCSKCGKDYDITCSVNCMGRE
jgi:hypothetical protein